jgi:hypothetical protein
VEEALHQVQCDAEAGTLGVNRRTGPLDQFSTVVIRCTRFSLAVGTAELVA